MCTSKAPELMRLRKSRQHTRPMPRFRAHISHPLRTRRDVKTKGETEYVVDENDAFSCYFFQHFPLSMGLCRIKWVLFEIFPRVEH